MAKERELEHELDAQDSQIEETHALHDQVIGALKDVRFPSSVIHRTKLNP